MFCDNNNKSENTAKKETNFAYHDMTFLIYRTALTINYWKHRANWYFNLRSRKCSLYYIFARLPARRIEQFTLSHSRILHITFAYMFT